MVQDRYILHGVVYNCLKMKRVYLKSQGDVFYINMWHWLKLRQKKFKLRTIIFISKISHYIVVKFKQTFPLKSN